MPTGYVEYDGVKLTRREARAVEKYDKGENLDHFDKQALERAEEKFNIQIKALEKKYEKK